MLRDEQRGLHAQHKGKGYAGVNAVLRADPFDSPKSVRPKGNINPTVAASGDTAMLKAGIKLVRSFRDSTRRRGWRTVTGNSM